ncbi:hypothetical protein DERF_001539 [Dermatophagoides farinae]|uniref:Uncharacterized protein n=1 Tax=Dermatophagoides farinae TaxID=6954 RepID=A0A922L9H6_DERFA|nr:hypothetical protein DERF_001539 [Dermatophagoides farinae]
MDSNCNELVDDIGYGMTARICQHFLFYFIIIIWLMCNPYFYPIANKNNIKESVANVEGEWLDILMFIFM